MICPKCEKEMCVGAIGGTGKSELFWADNEWFNSKICNLYTERDAIKNGGLHIPIGNGMTSNRTKAWVCKECKLVLVDCN